jgi:hypothetical protein
MPGSRVIYDKSQFLQIFEIDFGHNYLKWPIKGILEGKL